MILMFRYYSCMLLETSVDLSHPSSKHILLVKEDLLFHLYYTITISKVKELTLVELANAWPKFWLQKS